uniref:hypothetical protein n=1 Tax=uncultured Legionella sp. TaxID=210934 RepID=UPI002626607A
MYDNLKFFPQYKQAFSKLHFKDTSCFVKSYLLAHPSEDISTLLNLSKALVCWFSQDQIKNMALQDNGLKALEYITQNSKTLFCIPLAQLAVPNAIQDGIRAEEKNFILFATCIRKIHSIVINYTDPIEKLAHLIESNKSEQSYHFASKLHNVDYSAIE